MPPSRPSIARRVGALVRLSHPFPSLLDGLATAAFALLAGGDPATAVRLGVSMTALQVSIGVLNDVIDAPRDAGHKPGKPIPAGLVSPGSRRVGVVASAAVGARPRGAVGAGHRGPRRSSSWPSATATTCLAKGTRLVVAALRDRDPAPAGLRLARRHRHRATLVRHPRAGRGRRRGRAGDRQRTRGPRARSRRPGSRRSPRRWARIGRGRSRPCSSRWSSVVALGLTARHGRRTGPARRHVDRRSR